MKNWEKHKNVILQLKEILNNRNEGMDTEVEVLMPGDEGFDPSMDSPYVKVRYYTDENHYHERIIDLHETYFNKDLKGLVELIEHFIQEFEMEIDQSEFGGG